MEKKLIFIVICLGLIPLINASCVEDNVFLLGQEINICTGEVCVYQNETNPSQYVLCDETIKCKFSAFDPNNTLIVSYENMTKIGAVFNYSLGIINNSESVGKYEGQIDCLRNGEWSDPIRFSFLISFPEEYEPGETVGGITTLAIEDVTGEEAKEELSGGELRKLIFMIIFGVLAFIGLLILLFYLFMKLIK